MGVVVVVVIVALSIIFGAELGPKADAATTTYDPRGPGRHPLRRPVATASGIFVICAMSATVVAEGKQGGCRVRLRPRDRRAAGCEGCHRIGDNGNRGPGPALTHIGGRLPQEAIARTPVNPTAPMPSFRDAPSEAVHGRRHIPLRSNVARDQAASRQHRGGGPSARHVRPNGPDQKAAPARAGAGSASAHAVGRTAWAGRRVVSRAVVTMASRVKMIALETHHEQMA